MLQIYFCPSITGRGLDEAERPFIIHYPLSINWIDNDDCSDNSISDADDD